MNEKVIEISKKEAQYAAIALHFFLESYAEDKSLATKSEAAHYRTAYDSLVACLGDQAIWLAR